MLNLVRIYLAGKINRINHLFQINRINMPSSTGVSSGYCKAQLTTNIVKLSTQNALDAADVVISLECPGILEMIEQYIVDYSAKNYPYSRL